MTNRKHRGSLADAWKSPEFWTEIAITEFVRGLRRVMGDMKQKALARKLEVSESAVSQILSGSEENYTLDRMNRIAGALDAAVHVYVAKRDSVVRWTEEPTGPLGELRPSAQILDETVPSTDTPAVETIPLSVGA